MRLAIIFGIIGLIAAMYSVKTHYEGGTHVICAINDTFDCDTVNQSTYSKFLGIPVSLIGVAGYVFILLTLLTYKNNKNATLIDILGVATIVGLGFSLYLTSIEAFVLYTWCLVCLLSQLSMLMITISVLWIRAIDLKSKTLIHE